MRNDDDIHCFFTSSDCLKQSHNQTVRRSLYVAWEAKSRVVSFYKSLLNAWQWRRLSHYYAFERHIFIDSKLLLSRFLAANHCCPYLHDPEYQAKSGIYIMLHSCPASTDKQLTFGATHSAVPSVNYFTVLFWAVNLISEGISHLIFWAIKPISEEQGQADWLLWEPFELECITSVSLVQWHAQMRSDQVLL